MVRVGAEAARQLWALRDFYDEKSRPEASFNLTMSLARAIERIELAPEDGLIAPCPYPGLAQDGRRWIKEGRYWFRYSVNNPPTILAVFYETADIPGRIQTE